MTEQDIINAGLRYDQDKQDEHIKQLMRQALDKAFCQQIAHLYQIWLSNPVDLVEQRKRTAKGAYNAIDVYCVAMAAVDDWERDRLND